MVKLESLFAFLYCLCWLGASQEKMPKTVTLDVLGLGCQKKLQTIDFRIEPTKCRSKGRASGFVNFNLTKNITSPDFSILSESELHAIKVFSLFDCLVCNLPSAVEEILQNTLTFIRSARWSADCAQVVGSHCKRVSEHEYQCSPCITPITIWLYTSQNHSFQQMRKHECKEIYE